MAKTYMRKIGTTDIYIHTEFLEKRGDMEFCDLPTKASVPIPTKPGTDIINIKVPRETNYDAKQVEPTIEKRPVGRPRKTNV